MELFYNTSINSKISEINEKIDKNIISANMNACDANNINSYNQLLYLRIYDYLTLFTTNNIYLPNYLLYLICVIGKYNFYTYPKYMILFWNYESSIILNKNILSKYIVYLSISYLKNIKIFANLMYISTFNYNCYKDVISNIYTQFILYDYYEVNDGSCSCITKIKALYGKNLFKLRIYKELYKSIELGIDVDELDYKYYNKNE